VHRPGIRFDHQAKFHPRKYLAGLVRAIVALGGRLFEHSTVEEFTERPLGAKANGRTINIIVVTHTPLWGNAPHGRATWLETNLGLYSSYVIAGRAPKGAVPEALFWSTADPYAYLRVDQHRDYDLVIYGGEDHKTGQETDTEACYQRLEQALTLLVSAIELTNRWSGQVIETSDGLPFLGETADRQFVATGFSGNGMTFGTLGAMMACDRVIGHLNPWWDLFAPDRPFLKRGLWDYLRENKDYPYSKSLQHKRVQPLAWSTRGCPSQRFLRAIEPLGGVATERLERGGQLLGPIRLMDRFCDTAWRTPMQS
jgi:glycine/D-amino acid oxidase-like deaminating enzyme